MSNSLSAKRCQKRKIAPADQLKVINDIDMPFTMSALETIINFGQILEIKTVTLIKNLHRTPRPRKKPKKKRAKAHRRLLNQKTGIHIQSQQNKNGDKNIK